MAPLRALLASRAVIAGLATLTCLGLFISTLDNARQPIDWVRNNGYNNNNNNNNGLSNNVNHGQAAEVIHWDDAISPSSNLGRPLTAYPGRKPRTVQHLLEKAQGYYQRIIKQRHELLQQYHYGTPQFDPWHVLMYYWWYFPASFVCPHDIQRVGPLSDGGKWICGMSLYEEKPRAKCVIYSFGVNYETRFEGEMLDRTDCEIWAYDASVAAMGPEATSDRSHFKPYFIGREDHVDAQGKTWKTLKTLMKENGHDWIDILKVDIEGSEFETFDAIMDDFDVLPFSQLQMELHVREDMVAFSTFLKWWERLEGKGVYPWWTEINLNPTYSGQRAWASEYCFLNTRGGSKNLLIHNYE
ncbi:hypothetical protein BGZ99_008749 [Dissophora globulifera]|uniref:Methyltransferase domain-containing protein n=1 Tax=Dissophora globulifera TaxID=979702 RepID=A0A9P6R694_9FUNG|nr:hypothetical protein BGZ99_008749 [Dissophora globulifera]